MKPEDFDLEPNLEDTQASDSNSSGDSVKKAADEKGPSLPSPLPENEKSKAEPPRKSVSASKPQVPPKKVSSSEKRGLSKESAAGKKTISRPEEIQKKRTAAGIEARKSVRPQTERPVRNAAESPKSVRTGQNSSAQPEHAGGTKSGTFLESLGLTGSGTSSVPENLPSGEKSSGFDLETFLSRNTEKNQLSGRPDSADASGSVPDFAADSFFADSLTRNSEERDDFYAERAGAEDLRSFASALEEESDFDWEEEPSTRELFESSASFLSSLIFHLILLLLALFWTLSKPQGPGVGPQISMEFTTSTEDETWEDILLDETEAAIEAGAAEKADTETQPNESEILPEEEMVELEDLSEMEQDSETDTEMEPTDAEDALDALDWTNVSPADPNREGQETPAQEWRPDTLEASRPADLSGQGAGRSMPSSGGMGPRTDAQARAKMLAEAGGNAQSEAAVERGLAWIARHQQFDPQKKYFGSWNFDLSRFGSANSGEATSRTAATAMALLALMGHGNTREQGEYQKAVQDGIYYLSTQAKARASQPGYDFRDSPDSRGMYGHILAALALCEAYALEERPDPNLQQLAQGAIEWILFAQDPQGGGWRYQPHEAGDVSVTTWAVMALKSAQMAGIEIPSGTIAKLDLFLDSISHDEKAQYSYQPGKEPIPSTTAMGLSAKVFTGTPRKEEFLQRGIRLMSDWGCDPTDLYYDYYGTLLLRHYGGPHWESWNEEMRDYLILTQETNGRDAGSWFFTEPEKTNNQIGGRLYTTALAVMILEVYYRYLPIYQEKSSAGGL